MTEPQSCRALDGSSYAELDERANRLAHRLGDAGIGAGDFVGLQLVNGPEYLEGMLACFKIRAVPVNVNYRYSGPELRHLYGDAGLVGLIHHRAFGPAVGEALDAMADRRLVLEVDDDSAAPPARWALAYEAELAGVDPSRGLRPPFGRRPVLRLHGGHHRVPEGCAVAPRGHLLRRDGRRRSSAPR